MATPEILSLLCAGSTTYHAAGGRGKPLLTKAEIAGLLAGLTPEARDLALAKYTGCLASERMLVARVRTWAAGIAYEHKWEIVRGKPVVYTMCWLAVDEVILPNLCGTCNGTCYKGSRICPTCAGSGKGKLSGSAIASACGLSQPEYSRRWRDRYGLIYGYVADLDAQVYKAARKY